MTISTGSLPHDIVLPLTLGKTCKKHITHVAAKLALLFIVLDNQQSGLSSKVIVSTAEIELSRGHTLATFAEYFGAEALQTATFKSDINSVFIG